MEIKKLSEHYIPQLDALRAFAVTFVLLGHWIPEQTAVGKYIIAPIHLAQCGVQIFFVLSGFLIGSILIRNAYVLNSDKDASKWKAIKNFFIRRTLRIFPIYYVLLFFLFVINYPEIRVFFLWLLTYTTNFYIFKTQHWLGDYSHLWSLAVEEQFYLIFPWLIIFTKPRYLLKIILVFITTGVIFRACIYVFHIHPMAYNLTISLFDYFGMGALLAYCRINKIDLPGKIYWRILIGIIWFYFSITFWHFNGKSVISSLLPLTPLFFAFMIDYCCDTKRGVVGKILLFGPLLYIGRISYGIYLFHSFIPALRMLVFSKMNFVLNNLIINIILDFVLVIFIASLSYILLERPINKFKTSYRNIGFLV